MATHKGFLEDFRRDFRSCHGIGWKLKSSTWSITPANRALLAYSAVERAVRLGIDGDIVEAGVFRGGATIFMRALLAAHERAAVVSNDVKAAAALAARAHRIDFGQDHVRDPKGAAAACAVASATARRQGAAAFSALA